MELNLPGYETLDLLYNSKTTGLFRARRVSDGARVAIKRPHGQSVSAEAITRYRNEFDLLQSIDDDHVVKAVELLRYRGSVALVLEEFPGIPLDRWVETESPTLLERIKVAADVARAIGAVHEAGVIHKDISSSNIIVEPESNASRLIDFGSATRKALEKNIAEGTARLAGTLQYMSPEQTGRTNRGIDDRSDWYSFGMTLYELFSGRLPFESDDPVDWIHFHIAGRTPPLSQANPDIPEALSKVVMKLVDRAPESRYQSAAGVIADLLRSARELEDTGKISPFTPGESDARDRFEVPARLYGRDRETGLLLEAFQRVAGGGRELVLVPGRRGSGKSAVVRELRLPVTEKGGHFVTGNCQQLGQSTLFGPIVEALRSLVRQLLTESEDTISRWREQIQSALGINGQIVADLVPELELIVGPQPPVHALESIAAKNRFRTVFQQLFQVLASPEHPLVVCLEDMQWADAESIALVQLILSAHAARALLIIATFDQNSVTDEHDLLRPEQSGQFEDGIPVSTIEIDALDLESVSRLVADTLHQDLEAVRPLAGVILEKTHGKVFFIRQFLHALHADGKISYDPATRSYHCDVADAENSEVTENVAEHLQGQLRTLDAATQNLMRSASVVGRSFALGTLAAVTGDTPLEIERQLKPALESGFIVPVSTSTSATFLERSIIHGAFAFAHERLREAAFATLGADELPALHLAVGHALLANSTETEIERNLIGIVGHLNRGSALIEDESGKLELIALNRRAATRMRDSTAYRPASRLLRTAIGLLGPGLWEAHNELGSALHAELAEQLTLAGEFEEALNVIQRALGHVESFAIRARLYSLEINVYLGTGQLERSTACCLEAAESLGVDIKRDRADIVQGLQAEVDEVVTSLDRIGAEAVPDLPELSDDATVAVMALMTACLPAAFQTDHAIYGHIICKLTTTSLEHGNCRWSARAYGSFGALLASFGRIRDADRFARLGLELALRRDETASYSAAYFLPALFTSHWLRPIDESISLYEQAVHYGLETGDHQHLAYGAARRLQHMLFRGTPMTELQQECESALELFDQVGETHNRVPIQSYISLIEWLSGRRSEGDTLDTPDASESGITESIRASGNKAFEADWYVLLLRHRYHCDDYESARQFALKAEELVGFNEVFVSGTEFYFFCGLTFAALYPQSSARDRQEIEARLASYESKMAEWASMCPANREHMRLLLKAENARILGRTSSAMHAYDAAIEAASAAGFTLIEALAAELAAKFWMAEGKREFGDIYLQKSLDTYEEIGASGKASDLRQLFGRPRLASSERPMAVAEPSITSTAQQIDTLDLATILKASQTIAAEIVLDQLLAKLMNIVLENTGGERIVLVLDAEGELFVQGVKEQTDERPRLMLNEPLAKTARLSKGIVYFVLRTSEHVVLSEPARRGGFQTDSYVRNKQPKSVLCAPILSKGGISGVIYIENNQFTDAFTPNRLESLEILLSQIAISIENASLYSKQEAQSRSIEEANTALTKEIKERKNAEHELSRYRDHLEELVELRTQELEDANARLKEEAKGREDALAKLADSNERIRSLAYLDGLTGLPNRRLLNEHLEKILARSKRKHLEFAVLFVDLDNFKLINDTIGHQAADEMLCDLSESISELLRSEDVLALHTEEMTDLDSTQSMAPITESVLSRLGGDEFVVLLTEIKDRFSAGAVAQRVIHRLEQPFHAGGNDVVLSASVGIATYPVDGETSEVLLRNADTAMYHAKQQGKSTYQYYSEEMNAASVERLTLESGLRKALDEGGLELHYQPQVEIGSGRVVGLEALVRWKDPLRGYIPPATFIPVAEASGLILQIGEWTLREACRQAADWLGRGLPPVPVSINVSGVQFRRQDISALVRQALLDTQLTPASLCIEITETSLVSGLDRAAGVLQHLRDMGVSTSLDDFGTGYSSLNYLKSLPLDALKIDRSFTAELMTNRKTAALTHAIIDMTRTLGLRVVAEGIETREQLEMLRKLGCDIVQGFYFSPALPAPECEKLLEEPPAEWRPTPRGWARAFIQ